MVRPPANRSADVVRVAAEVLGVHQGKPELEQGEAEVTEDESLRSAMLELAATIRESRSDTLRDRFAMAALDCINTKVNEGPPLSPHWRDKTPRELAESAYRVADAMLAARDKT